MELVAPVDQGLVGLVRVSTDAQVTQLQRDALVAAGCGRIFEEKVSTRTTERPGLAAALDHLRPDAAVTRSCGSWTGSEGRQVSFRSEPR